MEVGMNTVVLGFLAFFTVFGPILLMASLLFISSKTKKMNTSRARLGNLLFAIPILLFFAFLWLAIKYVESSHAAAPLPRAASVPTSVTVTPTPELPTPTHEPTTAATSTPTTAPTNTPSNTPTSILEPTPTQAVPLVVAAASASTYAPANVDACGNPVSYEPVLAVDGWPQTAWRVVGNGVDAWIELEFAELATLSQVGIIAGYDKIDPCNGVDRFWENRIVRRVRLDFVDAGSSMEAMLQPMREIQYVPVPDVQTRRLRITILESSPPPEDGRDLIGISEIQVWGYGVD
jgi:hypothetical protein